MRFEFWRRCRKNILQKIHLVSTKRDQSVLPYLLRGWSELNHDSDIVRYVFRAIYFSLMFSKCQYPTRLVLESLWDTRFHSPFVQDPLVIKKSYLRHLHSESYIWSVKVILKNSYSLSYFNSTFRSQDFSLFKNFISRIFEEFRVAIIDIRLSTFVSQLTKFWCYI